MTYAGYNEPLDYTAPTHAPVRAREGLTEDDLRAIEARWSPYLVERKYIKRGLHQYRVTKAEPAPVPVGRTLSQVLAHQIVMEFFSRWADEYA